MRLASLGSGSRGNAVLVEGEGTRLLVDAGFSGVEIERRLELLGVAPGEVEAVVVTHEHRDHTRGAGIVARRWGWPLHMSETTRASCDDLLRGREEVSLYRAGEDFRVGGLELHPFLTCHDAADPLAVTVTEPATGHKLGVATDLGRATATARHALTGSNFLILEANHDEALLRDGPYPWSVKQRIAGSRGHLSNRLAAELAAELLHPELGGILLAHLSEKCNTPERALDRVRSKLDPLGYAGALEVAHPDRPSRRFDVERLLDRTAARREPQLRLFRTAGGGTG